MSIVIIHKDKDSVVVGSDTLIADEQGRKNYLQSKFVVGENFAVGVTGFLRFLNMIKDAKHLLDKPISVNQLLIEIREHLDTYGYKSEANGKAYFNLVDYKFDQFTLVDLSTLKIYEIDDSFIKYEWLTDYCCDGSGGDEARGVLTALDLLDSQLPVKKRVKLAIKTAKKLISSCGGKTYIERIKQVK